jgi:hypothetical protein
MKKMRITIATEPTYSLKLSRAMPGLLWTEILTVLGEYQKFEQGMKGTRFDTWLKKSKS